MIATDKRVGSPRYAAAGTQYSGPAAQRPPPQYGKPGMQQGEPGGGPSPSTTGTSRPAAASDIRSSRSASRVDSGSTSREGMA